MRINLITALSGYPYGTANAKRIKLIGKAIIESGNEFKVYTNSLSLNRFNNVLQGEDQGIYFLYLHNKLINKRLNISQKVFYYFKGWLHLLKIYKNFDRSNDIVYSYNHGSWLNLYIIFLCKIFKIKLIQEINEWYHNDLNRKTEKFIIEGPLIKHSNAAVVISGEIEKKVLSINPKIHTLKVPILEDFSNNNSNNIDTSTEEKICFWMGDVDGYIKDILFIIKAFSKVVEKGKPIKLFISGPYTEYAQSKISEVAKQFNYPESFVKLLGYVSEEELNEYCKKSYFFIVPLLNDERSKSRFPTKIASFMKAKKPIITCKIGEVGALLTDYENVLFYRENDYLDLADKVAKLLSDHILYTKIATEGYLFSSKCFNYKEYSTQFNTLVNKI